MLSLDFLLLFYGKSGSDILLPAFTAFSMLFWLLFAASNLMYSLIYNNTQAVAIKTATIVKSVLQTLMVFSFVAMSMLKARAEEETQHEEEEEALMSHRPSVRYRPNIENSPSSPERVSIATTL